MFFLFLIRGHVLRTNVILLQTKVNTYFQIETENLSGQNFYRLSQLQTITKKIPSSYEIADMFFEV